MQGRNEMCSRPDCDAPDIRKQPDEFFVERIVGRTARSESKNHEYQWLVKWAGYPIGDAEWIPAQNMGDSAQLISIFYDAARDEGLEVSEEGSLLLDEAIRGGWK
ncbi:hypothetical protein BC834DRAFT_462128 [Gloeopeniophorella convolvens]|nr:hypothetical protein BC834DRAFT_462128 [Gloeopeniophorella convolvens]